MKNTLTICAIVTMILAITVTAQAEMITKSGIFTDGDLGFTGQTIQILKFDSSLGDLTNVEIIVSGWVRAEVMFFNTEGQSTTFTEDYTSGTVSLVAPGVTVTPVSVSYSNVSGTVAAIPFVTQFFLAPESGRAALAWDAYVNAGNLADYVGTGVETVAISLTTGTFLSGATFDSQGGTIFVGGNAAADTAGVQVVYTYVPEPATLCLLALGGLLLRKRKA